MKKDYKYALYTIFFVVVLFGLSYLPSLSASPVVSWLPEKVETDVFPGGTRNIDLFFTTDKAMEDVEIRVVPKLRPFITLEPSSFDLLEAGESKNVKLIITTSTDTPLETFDGVIQIMGVEKPSIINGLVGRVLPGRFTKQRHFARPLPIEITFIDVQPAVDLFEAFLLEEFGTLTPPADATSDAQISVEATQELFDAFSNGTDGTLLFSIGSIEFIGPFSTNILAELALFDLLNEIELRGVNIDELEFALTLHDIHTENTEETAGLFLESGEAAIFFPRLPPRPIGINKYDQDGDGDIDHYVVILDNDTHSMHRAAHISTLVNESGNERFFNENNFLNDAAFHAIHELLHAMIFRTDCFDRVQFDDESIVGRMTDLINLKVQSSNIFTPSLRNTFDEHPEWGACLNNLGFVLPLPEQESPWPQYQHDARNTGQSQFEGPTTDNVKWTFVPPIVPEGGGNINTPIVGPDDIIYFGAGSIEPINKLYALNSDGSLKWESDTISAPPTVPVIVADGFVMIVAGTGGFGTNIYAFDKETGNELWNFFVGDAVNFITKSQNNTLYLTTQSGRLLSITPTQTQPIENWRAALTNERNTLVNSSPAIGLDGTIYVIKRGSGLGLLSPDKLFAIDPEDGSTKWTKRFRGNVRSNQSVLILDDGTIVVALPFQLRGVNPDGSDVFNIYYGGDSRITPSTPILLPNGTIAVVVSRTLHKINPETEEIISLSQGYLVTPNPIVDSQGIVYLNANPENILDRVNIVALSEDNTIIFTRTFDMARIVGHFALGSTKTLYIPMVIREYFQAPFTFKMTAIGEE